MFKQFLCGLIQKVQDCYQTQRHIKSESPAASPKDIRAQMVRARLSHCRVRHRLQSPRRPRLAPESPVMSHLMDEVDFSSNVDAHPDDGADRRIHPLEKTEKSYSMRFFYLSRYVLKLPKDANRYIFPSKPPEKKDKNKQYLRASNYPANWRLIFKCSFKKCKSGVFAILLKRMELQKNMRKKLFFVIKNHVFSRLYSLTLLWWVVSIYS